MRSPVSLIDSLIAPRVQASPEALRTARFIVGFLVALGACCFVYQAFYRQEGNGLGANLIFAEGFLAFGLIAVIRFLGWVRSAAHLFFVSFVVLVAALSVTMGGYTLVGVMPLLWSLTVPLAAMLSLGAAAGMAWVGVVGTTLTGLAVAHGQEVFASVPLHLDPGAHLFFVWIHIFGLGFMIVALGLLFAAANRSALESMAKASESARAMAERLEAEKASVEARIERATREAEERRAHLQSAVVAVLGGMERFAQGDLTVRFPEDLEEDMGRLAGGLNHTTESLMYLMQELMHVARDTAAASSQVDAASGLVARRTESQARVMQDTKERVSSISAEILSTAEQAGQTAELARRSAESAREGGEVVRRTLERVSGIARSVAAAAEQVHALGEISERISELVSTVDDIAAQTHMLALNASIEAARAGEQGKGFAVVAEEVRSLAHRTAEATRQIHDRTAEIQMGSSRAAESMTRTRTAAEEGARLSDDASQALSRIVDEMERMGELVASISRASTEQADVSSHVVQQIADASGAALESARDVTEITKSSAELQRLTEQLASRVANFRVA
jgi:methyl-accepting chemotaxis protein